MKLEMKDRKEVTIDGIVIVNPCCSGFTAAAQQGALRFFVGCGQVTAYLLKAVRNPERTNNKIHFCPYCGEKIGK